MVEYLGFFLYLAVFVFTTACFFGGQGHSVSIGTGALNIFETLSETSLETVFQRIIIRIIKKMAVPISINSVVVLFLYQSFILAIISLLFVVRSLFPILKNVLK